MTRRLLFLLAVMMLVYATPAFAVGNIAGTVTIGGQLPWTPVWIGIKSTPNALADPELRKLVEQVRAKHVQGFRLVQIGATKLPDSVELTYSFDLNGELSNLRLQVARRRRPMQ